MQTSRKTGTPDEKNLFRDQLSTPVDGQLLRSALRPIARERKEQEIKRAKKLARHEQRLPHIDNPSNVTISDRKFDEYVLNSAHPRGGNKAAVFAQAAGFDLVDVYESGEPEAASAAAAANPGYLKGRDSIISQIRKALPTTPADPQPSDLYRARMDTKHDITGPSGSLTVKAQWAYKSPNNDGVFVQQAHLATLQPSQASSSDDEQE
ncbi:MAG: hypothetical protein EOP64_02285 [Sphingomonas sp.]|nr:MAG: hypothetical protein EOP64_02285 [Sphingomonas sp.]